MDLCEDPDDFEPQDFSDRMATIGRKAVDGCMSALQPQRQLTDEAQTVLCQRQDVDLETELGDGYAFTPMKTVYDTGDLLLTVSLVYNLQQEPVPRANVDTGQLPIVGCWPVICLLEEKQQEDMLDTGAGVDGLPPAIAGLSGLRPRMTPVSHCTLCPGSPSLHQLLQIVLHQSLILIMLLYPPTQSPTISQVRAVIQGRGVAGRRNVDLVASTPTIPGIIDPILLDHSTLVDILERATSIGRRYYLYRIDELGSDHDVRHFLSTGGLDFDERLRDAASRFLRGALGGLDTAAWSSEESVISLLVVVHGHKHKWRVEGPQGPKKYVCAQTSFLAGVIKRDATAAPKASRRSGTATTNKETASGLPRSEYEQCLEAMDDPILGRKTSVNDINIVAEVNKSYKQLCKAAIKSPQAHLYPLKKLVFSLDDEAFHEVNTMDFVPEHIELVFFNDLFVSPCSLLMK
ncbi:uncharacterized protein M437DRAFT_64992 [Aureobasidium melanogenum CBS 110374]|uniref:Uncharacterized protein n=1 Tax=Aureobasidium melanogenum (strain CBS 110374) TaxID=1043003 RepID=A0A074VUJ5_AURM1|nr:uncharacterized protein M437DRAFT_64992 [Aureobasidium melanogenum CBS 110374]KEQ64455.1 hypothetical protein M437DRAFT_64992 [Aureobasidium melanogenum CBS 110374]